MSIKHSINGLVEVLNWMVSQGYPRESLLQNTGIDIHRLRDPHAMLNSKEELAFYQNLLDVSQDPDIIFKAGFNLKLSAYGMWGLALLSSPTLEKAIELGLQFVDFSYTYNKITFFREPNLAGLRISKSTDLGELQQPMVERDLSAIYALMKNLLQIDSPYTEVRVTWARSSKDTLYESMLHCPIHYENDKSEVLMDASLFDQELPQSNALTMQLCKENLQQLLPGIKDKDTIVEQVHNYFIRGPLFKASIENCAKEMAMSSRHLRRLITDEGTSFQILLDEFRQVLAEKYLKETELKLDDIAERLGYSDAANFSHAFKRWTGVSPRKISSGDK